MVQTFLSVFTDAYGDKNISADKRTQKYICSASSCPITDPKIIIGHPLRYKEIYRLKLYEASKTRPEKICRTYIKLADYKVSQKVF